MKPTVLALALLAASSSLFSQERPVPKDSTRLSISGCARGRVFTVGRDPEHESSSFVVELGTKIRLEGDKKVLADIKAREASMVELTGLMKQSDVRPPGIGIAGGRVRITPVMPNGRTSAPSPGPSPPILDVESYRLLNAACPNR